MKFARIFEAKRSKTELETLSLVCITLAQICDYYGKETKDKKLKRSFESKAQIFNKFALEYKNQEL